MGDSPKMCRALDSHGFADLKAGLLTYASFTSVYPKNDSRRFHLGTPPQLLASIERTWRVTPISKRIVKDIELLPDVLGKIIKAPGCVVQDEEFCGLRLGRRTEGSGQLAPKVRKHQRLMVEMVSTVPHIEDIADLKALIKWPLRTGFDGRSLAVCGGLFARYIFGVASCLCIAQCPARSRIFYSFRGSLAR